MVGNAKGWANGFAGQLVERVVSMSPGDDALWNLTGSVGAGKTTVLQLVQHLLWDRKMIPVLVSAPQGEIDAGPVALLSVADQLQAVHLTWASPTALRG